MTAVDTARIVAERADFVATLRHIALAGILIVVILSIALIWDIVSTIRSDRREAKRHRKARGEDA